MDLPPRCWTGFQRLVCVERALCCWNDQWHVVPKHQSLLGDCFVDRALPGYGKFRAFDFVPENDILCRDRRSQQLASFKHTHRSNCYLDASHGARHARAKHHRVYERWSMPNWRSQRVNSVVNHAKDRVKLANCFGRQRSPHIAELPNSHHMLRRCIRWVDLCVDQSF